jgi:hypothetical protein
MEEGPVTSSYGKDPEDVISVLNEVVATEIVCWMRYTRHAISASGINRAQVAGEFTEHAESERGRSRVPPSRLPIPRTPPALPRVHPDLRVRPQRFAALRARADALRPGTRCDRGHAAFAPEITG